jgi:hypothetical protein
VTAKSRSVTLERIAFATTESEPHALETIVALAAGNETGVSCVFIEDVDLLRAAQLPFALEVCRATNVVRRTSSSEVERGLKERAAAAKKLVVQTAEQAGAKWSFEVIRQRPASAVLELAKRTDITVFSATGSLRYRDGSISQLRSRTRSLSSLDTSIVVLVDRSAASARAVQVAQKLATVRGLPVCGVVVAATKAGVDRLADQLHRIDGLDLTNFSYLLRPEFTDIVMTARAYHPAAAVLPISQIEDSSNRIHELEEAIGNPILIVT